MKISQDVNACTSFLDIRKISVDQGTDRILTETPGIVGDGGNSGFQAINIVAQFGVRRIALVGFDMRVDQGVHWHGNHGNGLNNPRLQNVIKWRRVLDRAAGDLASLGIDVINCSEVSALTAYRKMSLLEALDL